MATTTKADLISPEVLADAVSAELRGTSFMFGTGAIQIVNGLKLTDSQKEGGEKVKVPYFNHMGEFEDVAADGGALTVEKIGLTTEESPVIHSGKAFGSTELARISAAWADPEAEAARQMARGARRRIEREAIKRARDVAGSTSVITDGATIAYDAIADFLGTFGDEEDGIVAIAMHSKVRKDIRKLKDTTNQPLFVDPLDGSVPRLMGRPVLVSDMCAQVFPTVVEVGTAPPDVTITGELIGAEPASLRIEITTLGARGIAAFRYSLDGGTTFSDPALTAAAVVLGKSGLTANFSVGNYALDNVYTAAPRFETLALKRGAILVWIQNRPEVLYDTDILTNTRVLATHLYFVVHPYGRLRGSTRSGIGRLRTM